MSLSTARVRDAVSLNYFLLLPQNNDNSVGDHLRSFKLGFKVQCFTKSLFAIHQILTCFFLSFSGL